MIKLYIYINISITFHNFLLGCSFSTSIEIMIDRMIDKKNNRQNDKKKEQKIERQKEQWIDKTQKE